jgi:hypothetical protein
MKAVVDDRRRMAGDDFLEPDVPDAELPDRDSEGEAEGAIAPDERIGLTPPD